MQKFFTHKLTKKIGITSILAIEFILNLTTMLLKTNGSQYSFMSFKNNIMTGTEPVYLVIVGVLFFALLIDIALSIMLALIQSNKEKITGNDMFILLTINAVIVLLQLLFGKYADVLTKVQTSLLITQVVFIALAYAWLLTIIHFNNIGEKKETKINNTNRVMNLVIATIAIIFNLIVFFLPLYTITSADGSQMARVSLLDGLKGFKATFEGFTSSMNIILFIELSAFVVLFVINLAYYLAALKYFYYDYDTFYHKSHVSVIFSFVYSLIYFIVGLAPILNTANSFSLSFIPFVIMSFLIIAIYAFSARYEVKTEKSEKRMPKIKVIKRFEVLFFVIAFAGIFVGSFFVDLVKFTANIPGFVSDITVNINCIDILTNFSTLGNAYRAIAFLLVIASTIIAMFVLATIALFISRSKLFVSIAFAGIVVEYFFMFALSLFGIYFVIVQNMSLEMAIGILNSYGYSVTSIDSITLSSLTYTFFLADCGLLLIIILLKPFTTLKENEEMDINIKSSDVNALSNSANGMAPALATNDTAMMPMEDKEENKADKDDKEEEEKKLKDFDACPAFSELDSLKPEFDDLLKIRKKNLFKNPSLLSIVNFVVMYAANSRLHLSYTNKDIATFVAGLGMGRLTILQGMSGTGKTSLPKIFSEALYADCDIVEVESSWKDKNELLGYYNDFSKTFTPKKFTQALYEASLKPEVITFIVLDEMNLSRIEYYFSDFLSLMENEEDKREIKLLNVKLYNTYDGERHSYLSLVDNHTLKIPTNVFFIGTANRDESTFEISDKVYDRANTMNFDKRAKPIKEYSDPLLPSFLPYKELKDLLDNAKNSYNFSLDGDERVKKIEDLLAPYNISFGNRVYNQIENFVKVYCSCFENPKEVESEALEKIIFSKVVHKLEFKAIDDKEYLVHEFEKLGFYMCSEFISKINGDF